MLTTSESRVPVPYGCIVRYGTVHVRTIPYRVTAVPYARTVRTVPFNRTVPYRTVQYL